MQQPTNSKKPVGNILDMMTPEHKAQAISRFKKRMEKRENEENRVTSEIYLMSEFGYYYGWEGIQAIRNNEITLDEVFVLLEGARKVWYAKRLEINNMTRVAIDSSNPFGKKVAKMRAYEKGVSKYVERTKLAE